MAVHKWGYKMSREFARRMPSYRGEVAGGHPAFSAKSQAAPRLHNGPVPISAPKFEYTDEDEKAIEDYIRQAVRTAWHSVCFCLRLVIALASAYAPLARNVCDEEPREGRSSRLEA